MLQGWSTCSPNPQPVYSAGSWDTYPTTCSVTEAHSAGSVHVVNSEHPTILHNQSEVTAVHIVLVHKWSKMNGGFLGVGGELNLTYARPGGVIIPPRGFSAIA